MQHYPECDFATNFSPFQSRAPNAAGLMTEYRGNQAKCIKCGPREKFNKTNYMQDILRNI